MRSEGTGLKMQAKKEELALFEDYLFEICDEKITRK